MIKYVKKPIVIEAEQFIISDYKNVPKVIDLMGMRYEIKGESFDLYIEIPTLEGIMKAKVTDFIIKGINGEFYPCKKEIFHKTYDPIFVERCEKFWEI